MSSISCSVLTVAN